MATAFHVNGPAILYDGYSLYDSTHANIAGVSQALDDPGVLGVSVDGVDVSVQTFEEPIIADTGGPHCPVDLQDMGMVASIHAQLVIYDLALLAKLRKRASGTPGTYEAEGALPPMGTLITAGGFARRLIVLSDDETCWRFWNTKLRGAWETKLGTKKTIWNLHWSAWAWIGTQESADGSVLYDHVNA